MTHGDTKEIDIFRIYKLLDHPIRKEIIELLGEQEKLGFKELREKLQINVGALYYHFDALSDLIAQDENRKYMLTDLGKMAHGFLTSQKAQLVEVEVKERARTVGLSDKILRGVKSVFLPSGLFVDLYESPKKHIADIILIWTFGSWLLIETKLEPILFFFNFGTFLPPAMIVAKLLIGLLVVIAVSEAVSRFFFQRSGGSLCLLIGVSFSLLPLFVLPMTLLLENLNFVVLRNLFWFGILQFFLQAWSLCLLSKAISLSKGLRIEKAAVISLVLIYLNLGYIYFTMRL